jgi:hypothetical protein
MDFYNIWYRKLKQQPNIAFAWVRRQGEALCLTGHYPSRERAPLIQTSLVNLWNTKRTVRG